MWKVLLPLLGLMAGPGGLQAEVLQECEGVIISRIQNSNPDCSEFVYCNGEDSFYCNGDCLEPVECYRSESESTTLQPPIAAPTTPPTLITTVPPTVIPTTPKTTTTSKIGNMSTTKSTSRAVKTTTELPSTDFQLLCKIKGDNAVYPYPANPNYYYHCIAGYLLLQQCPQNFHFDAIQGQCITVAT
ncbi:uncharacterized protein [Drosophila tropicalis]|uniref:uncharacterized protein n=1 Tax=Drosophila tropicalis TaxID=46794 RepID=UPI0035AC00C0